LVVGAKQAIPMTDTDGEELFYSYQGYHYHFRPLAKA
jgi:hypothetical protein